MPAPTQREFWNGPAGAEWVRQQVMLDAMLEPMMTPAIDALGAIRGKSLLDIGCGAGTTSFALAQRGAARVLGVDISAPLVAHARGRAAASGASVRFLEADAGADNLPDGPYDALFSRFGVMFFDRPEAAFALLRAHLRPGARLAFVCWRGIEENQWFAIGPRAVAPLLSAAPPPMDPTAPGPMAFANPDRVRAVLSGGGWRDIVLTAWDGEMTVGDNLASTTEFVARNSATQRVLGGAAVDMDKARALIAEALRPLIGADGKLRTPGACWIVTARA